MNITDKYLLDYIAHCPELSGFHIRTVERSDSWANWQTHRLELCHTSFSGNSLVIVSVANGETQKHISNALRDLISEEDDALMLSYENPALDCDW